MGTTPFVMSLKCGFLPDSICPKGWELPRYENDKSYQKLLVDTYGQQKGEGTGYNGDKGVFGVPLSFFHAGDYGPGGGTLGNRGLSGGRYYWESRDNNATVGRNLNLKSTLLSPQTGLTKGYGISVHCVSK